MSTLSCTIGGNSVIIANASFSLANALENRSILTLTVLDSPGTANYTPGQPVVFTDSVQGITYSGYVNTSQPTKLGIAGPFVAHVVTCVDKQRLLDKRTNKNNYLNWYAGDIATNFIDTTLAAEGVTAAYATRRDTTANDFNKGILSGVVGTSNVGDGDLELTLAGTAVTIMEDLTADFATGTLLNVQATVNSLIPTSTTAISCSASLLGAVTGSFMAINIWSGSMTVGTLDILNYDLWIVGTSPQNTIMINLYFSDGTQLSSYPTAIDQNGLSSATTSDISYAKNAWYSRSVALSSALNGKVINNVTITIGGTSLGSYAAYVKNIYLSSQSGNKFFAIGATTSNISPPQIFAYAGYLTSSVISKVVNVFIANNAFRISPAYSINAVKLLRSSLISWDAQSATGVFVSASYDGGASYALCTNNAALPALPSGANVAGLTLTLKEAFNATGSTDPTVFPVLNSVNISLLSAPNATKSDIVQNYITASDWNTGTYTSTILSGNNLTLGNATRDWNDTLITNQTLFAQAGTTQTASGGNYAMTTPASALSTYGYGQSRLDFCQQLVDFTLDVDLNCFSTQTVSGNVFSTFACVTYRQTSWQAGIDNAFAYMVQMYPNHASGVLGTIELGYGSNGTTNSYTQLAVVSQSISTATFYHVKVVVRGTHHQVYFNNSATPTIDLLDNTYQQVGFFGLRGACNMTTSGITKWDNLVIQPIQIGTWQSGAVSINSLTTCGLSALYWTEALTTNQALASILIQTSIDGGSTFQNCTNGGGIPNLPSGTTVTGKSIIVKATLTTLSQTYIPVLSQMVWRVLGAYPGSSGTRSTLPLAYDTATRANVGSGFGVGTDGQTYTQIGTATTNLTSNKLQITNTTGDVHMLYGSRVAGDCEGTVRFTLSASSIVFGMELHYGDVNNYYRFYASTTTLTIQKRLTGVSTTLQTASMALATGTAYRMRFRIVGSGPVNLYGRVWASGILEPTSWNVTAIDL